jgi:hypothetical protein
MGEEKVWDILSGIEPGDVCQGAQAVYDRTKGIYTLKSFGWDIHVSPKDRNIFSDVSGSSVLLEKLGEFSTLSILHYLAGAKELPLAGQLVRPDNLKGGHLFSKGTHVLPLNALSEKYHADIDGFLLKGRTLGAEKLQYGDCAIKLLPMPRLPVTLIFWKGDDEFPPRSDLLFDSTSEFQASIDILWSIAMMSVLIMM